MWLSQNSDYSRHAILMGLSIAWVEAVFDPPQCRWRLQIAGDPKSVIGILKFRRDAGACRTARYLDVVTPGAAA
jgi:hypothetical protein